MGCGVLRGVRVGVTDDGFCGVPMLCIGDHLVRSRGIGSLSASDGLSVCSFSTVTRVDKVEGGGSQAPSELHSIARSAFSCATPSETALFCSI